jgi:transmembrane sensor
MSVQSEALQFHTKLRTGDATPAELAQFRAWLAADPAHADAFAEIEDGWTALDELAQDPDILRLRSEALEEIASQVEAPARRRFLARAATAAVVSVGVGGGVWWASVAVRDRFQTARGERRDIELPDGSRLQLDADSEAELHYTRFGRAVRLHRGRGHFDVRHETLRPFLVQARALQVEAVGTSFDVADMDDGISVTVGEGVVAIADASQRWRERLSAGRELTLDVATGERRVGRVDIERAAAWRVGRLEVDAKPLAQVAKAFRHYSEIAIEFDDAKAAATLVSGRFDLSDPNGFVDSVVRLRPLRIVARNSTVIRLASK